MEEAAAQDVAVPAQDQVATDALDESEVLDVLGLPDPDSLRPGDDFSAFMAKAVPEVIRRRALRTLWRSNPILANVDMLVDYGEDFTDSATVVENMQTAYQVGKGMLKHIEEMARQAAEVEDPAPADEEHLAEAEDLAVLPDLHEQPEPSPAHDPEVAHSEEEIIRRPRRMTFEIEETA